MFTNSNLILTIMSTAIQEFLDYYDRMCVIKSFDRSTLDNSTNDEAMRLFMFGSTFLTYVDTKLRPIPIDELYKEKYMEQICKLVNGPVKKLINEYYSGNYVWPSMTLLKSLSYVLILYIRCITNKPSYDSIEIKYDLYDLFKKIFAIEEWSKEGDINVWREKRNMMPLMSNNFI